MRSKLKSQPTRPESPHEPKYLEFIIFAVLAVVGSIAIVVLIANPTKTPQITKANQTEILEDKGDSIPMTGSEDNEDEPTENMTADFEQEQPAQMEPERTYSLIVSGANGSVAVNPDQTSYNDGDTVILEAVPETGHIFTNWSGDLSGDTNPTKLVMDADKSVTARFTVKTYNLTTVAVNGSVEKRPDQSSYNHGDTVTLEAVPNTGYRFTNWSGDMSGDTNPAKMVMNEDKSIAADFTFKTYNLLTSVVGGPAVGHSAQAGYKHGDTVTLEAVPNTGYSFTNWSGDLSGDTNPATLVMDADKSVTATFTHTAQTSDVKTNSIDIKLVYIPSGSFMMGSSASAAQLAKEYNKREADFADELPQHEVIISKDFWMGQTEVTQGQYELIMNSRPWSGKAYVQENANNPAVYVSWDEAMEFCRRLSQQEGKTFRLPTEAEWEYACRAGTSTRFSFGDNDLLLDDYSWFDGNADKIGQDYAHEVGQKKPNTWGLYDMHGNVFEWCMDYYDEKYYSNSPSIDPNGPSSGTSHSLRSGSWDNDISYLRCSYRSDYPVESSLLVGFRVVTDGEAYTNTGTMSIAVESTNNGEADTNAGNILISIESIDSQANNNAVTDDSAEVEPIDEQPGATDDNLKTEEDASISIKVPADGTATDDDLSVVDNTNEVSIGTDSTLNYIQGNTDDILDQAAVDARTDKMEQALAVLNSLLNDENASVMAGYELGLIHYENGDVDKAIPFFKNALAIAFPESASDRDEQALTKLLNQEADAARIRYELGLIYESEGKQDQAAKLFRDGLSIISTQGATYIGIKKCKSCHFNQWNSWRTTKMATTFEVLKPGVRSEEKTKLNFDPNKDYTKDATCLGCHTSGFDMPGGYIIPTDGDTEAQEQASDNVGVTCEGCHGPGSKSMEIQEDIKEKKRPYTFAELRAVGFQKADVRSCTPCHNSSDPGKEPGYHFVYEENRTEDQHKNFELKYRQD